MPLNYEQGVALMAHIERFGSYVVLALTKREKFFALHSSPQAKFSEIISVRKARKAWSWTVMRGMRAPGVGIPYLIALGTWRYRGGKSFIAVYGKRPAYIVTFKAGKFKQWIFTPDNSEEEMGSIFHEYINR